MSTAVVVGLGATIAVHCEADRIGLETWLAPPTFAVEQERANQKADVMGWLAHVTTHRMIGKKGCKLESVKSEK